MRVGLGVLLRLAAQLRPLLQQHLPRHLGPRPLPQPTHPPRKTPPPRRVVGVPDLLRQQRKPCAPMVRPSRAGLFEVGRESWGGKRKKSGPARAHVGPFLIGSHSYVSKRPSRSLFASSKELSCCRSSARPSASGFGLACRPGVIGRLARAWSRSRIASPPLSPCRTANSSSSAPRATTLPRSPPTRPG